MIKISKDTKSDNANTNKFLNKVTDDNKDIYVALAVTIYLVVKTMINGDFKGLVIEQDFFNYMKILGDILNDLILAYIPIGVFTLTTKGKKLQGGRYKERMITGLISLVIGVFSTYIMSYIVRLLENHIDYKHTLSWDHPFYSLGTIAVSGILIFFQFAFLSIAVNNIIIFILRFLTKKSEKETKINITNDMFLEQKGINIHNYWYELLYIKVYIISENDVNAKVNVYNEMDDLKLANYNTKIKVKDDTKIIELEQEINDVVKKKIEQNEKRNS
ncbi:hypothetical protein F1Z12_03320 [Staphylococcus aureus]|uniref:hypothetical protein n=1 Tax=Staphylococcus epidermidis TaxID=1282 RepID=UPI0005E21F5C|nr:hypothetical protein [Staphylococcus epidermidis]MBD6830258.1 hypothetical protein [Staphylococcus aureus]CPD16388.1 Uncharacterised protein [Staphylococcus aureus]SUM50498.1 Uncharacterised protein [Staphylococcus epidermidis]HCV2499329.1 hypothetical protein [Staphylococcus aureus]HCY0902265.1 hypothetical protein [Staphylococcus aureus]